MIAVISDKKLQSSADSRNNTKSNYRQKSRCYSTKHTKRRAQAEKRERLFNSLDWQLSVLIYVIYCIHLSTEHVCPAQATLGDLVGINRDTCRSRLRMLVDLGWLSEWEFRFYQTCIYKLPKGNRQQIAYLFRGVKRPKGFKVPPWLFGMIMGNMTATQGYSLLKYDITHESFLKKGVRDKKYIENGEKLRKKLLKCKFGSPDPIMANVLMKKYNLNNQKAEFLARNEVRVISIAMEDLDTYVENFGKTVVNHFGFLLNRCKYHGSELYRKRKQQEKKQEPKPLGEWLTSYFKAHGKRFIFISKERDLDPTTKELRPFIQFLKHKSNIKKSILKVWQKVGGAWIDKVFTFDRPDLADSIENYLENSLKFQGI